MQKQQIWWALFLGGNFFDFFKAMKVLITRGAVNRKFLFAGSKSTITYFSVFKINQSLVSGSIPNIFKTKFI